MEYQEFITHVQTMAQSASREEAERATRATLETLKERIPGEEVAVIAAELPSELSQFLQQQQPTTSESFNLQEFIWRVSQRENIEPTITAIHVRAVFAVLQNAINSRRFSDFQAYFPHDYEELFTKPSTSEVSPG